VDFSQVISYGCIGCFEEKQKDSAKTNCSEAMQFAIRQNPGIANEAGSTFVT
jgi:hypothetical protein